MGMYDDCPCRYCEKPKRHELCHSHCPDKAAWDAKVANAKELIRQEREKSDKATGFISDMVAKTNREMRRLKRK